MKKNLYWNTGKISKINTIKMHFTYTPSVSCPSCKWESEWNEIEDSTQFPQGIECPRCGDIIPINEYQVKAMWHCSACNAKVNISDCTDHHDGTYGCISCGSQGQVTSEIGSFEKFFRNEVAWYLCPYCNTDLFAEDLVQGNKGQIIFCPVCNKLGEI